MQLADPQGVNKWGQGRCLQKGQQVMPDMDIPNFGVYIRFASMMSYQSGLFNFH